MQGIEKILTLHNVSNYTVTFVTFIWPSIRLKFSMGFFKSSAQTLAQNNYDLLERLSLLLHSLLYKFSYNGVFYTILLYKYIYAPFLY